MDAPIVDLDLAENESNSNNSSSSKRRSLVYEYFTFKTPKWHCNYCSKQFSDKATTTLWRHINENHLKVCKTQKGQGNEENGEIEKYINRKESVSLVFTKFLISNSVYNIYLFVNSFSLARKGLERG